MKITIDIDDRLCEDIKAFCKLNNMTYTKYLSQIITERFNIDRFGDLNEKIKPRKEKIVIETSPVACITEKQVVELVTKTEKEKPIDNTPVTNKRRQLKTL